MGQYMDTPKQPWDVYTVSMCFQDNLSNEEVIDVTKSSVVIYDRKSGDDVTSDLSTGDISLVDDNTLMVVLSGGVNGRGYKISFRAYISDTKKLEEDLFFVVRD